MKHDIVYILKNNISSDEIRYSLRSVEKNFPYHKIWFYGGCPDGIKPDEYVEVIQSESTKWARATSTIKAACQNDEITEDFWLFNDDFFIMKRIRVVKPMYRGTLQQRVKSIAEKHGGLSTRYSRQLSAAAHLLKLKDLDQLNYALHVPMLINRKKALEVFEAFPDNMMFRSLYGNYWNIGGKNVPDVKVLVDKDYSTETAFLSTSDKSFEKGLVGEYIRNKFNEPSKYEEDAMT